MGVGGCWAQSVKEEVFERFPFVDVAFGPGQIHRLAEFLTQDSLTAQGYFEFEDFSGHLPAKRAREFQGWVQISLGCNCVCAYCIVPSTRGREVSRDPGELVAEVEALAADGVREVTLLGQNVNSYGRDLPARGADHASPSCWPAWTPSTGSSGSATRARIPKDMREDVIRAHAELPALCEHIHLPLQSGSSRVLKAMRRTYDRERYLDRVALIREHVPDCALTTDIIVGFPGETEEDFAETLEVVDEVGYDGAFTFIFSPRRGHRGGGPSPTSSRTPSSASAWSRSSSWSSTVPASAPSASSGARWRCWSRGRAGPTRRGCGAARATTRRSTSTAPPSPASWSRSRSRRATSHDAERATSACSAAPLP